MSNNSGLLDRFKPALLSQSSNRDFVLGTERGYTVYYVPFDLVNADARLALVGITPGPVQMTAAYAEARVALLANASNQEVLFRSKRAAAFAGMRARINAMLDHFEIPHRLGIPNAAALWDSHFSLFETTSIVPYAAFKAGAYFNGPFTTVLAVPLLRDQFERVFVPSLEKLSDQVVYVGMGPVVDDALRWCASRGIIKHRQVLGYFPHASGSSGSQFAYFLRRKSLADMKPTDPVRHRVRDLDAAYERIAASVQALCQHKT